MLKYLSKFVLEIMPSIIATVIGAYIVSTYISPKTPPGAATTAASASQGQAATASSAADIPARERDAKETAQKPADAGDKPKPVKAAAAPADVRIIPIVKERAVKANAPAAPAPAVETTEERKDVNDLARAALQRQRPVTEPAAAPVIEPANPQLQAVRPSQPARPVVEQASLPPEVSIVAAPPMPPAVSVAAPRYPQAEQPSAPVPVAAPVLAAVPSNANRPTPPADVPLSQSPLDLRPAQRVGETPSVTDGLLSATKSFFRAITPE